MPSSNRSSGRSAARPKRSRDTRDRRGWIVLAAALIALLIAYAPALGGTPVWDDAGHITRPEMQSGEGLRRIWTEPGSTQQYYPLLHSAFWAEHRLWGNAALGYHVTNVVLHALSTLLVWLILKRLESPGAMLAAAVFALHPVQVESVAWITEQKNTLSGVFFLLSALAYFDFDESRRQSRYVVALSLFVAALLSKSVTAVLPAMLAVALWWKRGRLTGRRDLVPLIPFVAIAAASGAATAWMERAYFGAQGAEFTMTPLERLLLAARATWFYLSAMVWPSNLTFNYPRWHIDPSDAVSYVALALVVLATAALWLWRNRARGPLAAWLAFGFGLSPALGFVNVYPFRYAFVADHFAYLAVIPFAAAVGAIVAVAARERRTTAAIGAAIAVVLGSLTFRDSRAFESEEALYRTTIARNPASWFAHNNLGRLLLDRGQLEESRTELLAAVRLESGHPEPLANLARVEFAIGNDLQGRGRLDEAIAHYRAALAAAPDDAAIHNNLGGALGVAGRYREAEAEFETALRLAPNYREAQENLRRLRTVVRGP